MSQGLRLICVKKNIKIERLTAMSSYCQRREAKSNRVRATGWLSKRDLSKKSSNKESYSGPSCGQ